MFHLVNQYGNVHKKVESERKRDELIAAGYKLVEEPVEVAVEEPVEVAVEEPVEVAVEEPVEVVAEGEEKPKKGKVKKNAAEE